MNGRAIIAARVAEIQDRRTQILALRLLRIEKNMSSIESILHIDKRYEGCDRF